MVSRVSHLSLLVASIALFGLASLASCAGREPLTPGGTGGSGAGSGTGGAPYDGVPLSAFAHTFEVCSSASPPSKLWRVPSTSVVSGCHDLRGEHGGCSPRVSAVKKGTAGYDPNAAAACIASLPTDCEVNQGWGLQGDGIFAAFYVFAAVPACNAVFTGLLSPGGGVRHRPRMSARRPLLHAHSPRPSSRRPASLHSANPAPTRSRTQRARTAATTDSFRQLPSVCAGTCIVPPGEGEACDPTATFPCGRMDGFLPNKQTTGRPEAESASNASGPVPLAGRPTLPRRRTPASPDARCVRPTERDRPLHLRPLALLRASRATGPASACSSLNCASDNICSPSPSGAGIAASNDRASRSRAPGSRGKLDFRRFRKPRSRNVTADLRNFSRHGGSALPRLPLARR